MQWSTCALVVVVVVVVVTALAAADEICFSCFRRPTWDHIHTERDVVYGVAFNAITQSQQQLLMDMYYPNITITNISSERLPALIVVHGGACITGSRAGQDQVKLASRLAALGYVVASIDYRLYGDCFQGAEPAGSDTKAAVRFLRSHATTWHIDPERIALVGSSAGAIASLHAAYVEAPGTSGANNPTVSSEVSAVVSISGVLVNSSAANDIAQLEPSEAPLYLLHGSQDIVVPVLASVQLYAQALHAGLPAVLRMNSANHVPWDLVYTTYWADILQFLYTHLRLDSVRCPAPDPTKSTCASAWVAPAFAASEGEERLVTVKGQTRRFRAYLAKNSTLPTSSPRPLLLAFHDHASDAEALNSATGLARLGTLAGYHVLFLEGSPGAEAAGRLTWNAGTCCGTQDDVAFVATLLASLPEQGLAYDGLQVFGFGQGLGGAMVRRLHCALPAQLTAAMTSGAALAQRNVATCVQPCDDDSGNVSSICFNTAQCSLSQLSSLPTVFSCDWEAATLRRPPLFSIFESGAGARPYTGGLPLPAARVPAPWNATVRLPAAFELATVYAQYRSAQPNLTTSLPAVPGIPGTSAAGILPDAVFPNVSTHCVACPDCVASVVTCVAGSDVTHDAAVGAALVFAKSQQGSLTAWGQPVLPYPVPDSIIPLPSPTTRSPFTSTPATAGNRGSKSTTTTVVIVVVAVLLGVLLLGAVLVAKRRAQSATRQGNIHVPLEKYFDGLGEETADEEPAYDL